MKNVGLFLIGFIMLISCGKKQASKDYTFIIGIDSTSYVHELPSLDVFAKNYDTVCVRVNMIGQEVVSVKLDTLAQVFSKEYQMQMDSAFAGRNTKEVSGNHLFTDPVTGEKSYGKKK